MGEAAANLAPSSLELATRAVEQERAAQKPRELAGLIEWLRVWTQAGPLTPRAVLEIGAYRGGTLWLWRQLWPHARIVAIDDFSLERCEGCERRIAHTGCSNRRIHEALGGWPRGRLLRADSRDPHTRDLARYWLEGRCDFLFIDGDHSAAGVRRDFELYEPLVQPGGMIVLHDVAGDAFPGVAEFWRELEREPGAFLILEERTDWGGLGVLTR